MKSILIQLRGVFAEALLAAFGEAGRGVDPLIRASGDAKFGDYQSNVAMSLAKTLGKKPREVAEAVVAALCNPPHISEPQGITKSQGITEPQPLGSGVEPSATEFSRLCEKPEIAGPGFINLRLRPEWAASILASIPAEAADATADATKDRLGIEPAPESERETVVVDYSSPNVAKQMHVGHLRSTIIGDTISRVLEFEGQEVIRQNHVGDWGTQFGIILEQLRASGRLTSADTSLDVDQFSPEELEATYRIGQQQMSDPDFANRARQAVIRLQWGNTAECAAWERVVSFSKRSIEKLYRALRVKLEANDWRGESFYKPLLRGVVEELRLAFPATPFPPDSLVAFREDQGAQCVFIHKSDGSPAFIGPEGAPLPMIVQKSDGAYLYASTDLAAAFFRIHSLDRHALECRSPRLHKDSDDMKPIRYDVSVDPNKGGLGADRILYVVGAPQKLHFEMFFATVHALGWTRPATTGRRPVPREVKLEHVSFGSVLGEDKRPLKTRSGENVKLKELLDEAVKRAREMVEENAAKREAHDEGRAAQGTRSESPLTDAEKADIAEAVGIGAVKYADLCQNRNSDYVFSWDKMLAMQGNTAPYLMYAYARVRSIFRKGAEAAGPADADSESKIQNPESSIRLDHPAEIALGKRILQLPETLDAVSETLFPHILCEYLYDLAGKFMAFYENCPVLNAPDAATRGSRLRLCDLTARALRLGLDLLGIRVLERM